MPAEYIHGTAAREQARLTELNRLTNAPFVAFLAPAPGARVLEVGSGLGVLAAAVAASATGVEVVGVERSSEQLAAAVQAERVRYVCGDAHQLEFSDASFDLVYARYVLEHVARPEQVLREMRRVLRPGGRVVLQENDISLQRTDPECPAFDQIWQCFAKLQRQLGGDALIGRKLFGLLRRAGFDQVELSVQPELHWAGSPGLGPWIENLIGNVESGQQALVTSGLASAAQVARAIEELRELRGRQDVSLSFVWNRAEARRGD